MSKDGTSDCWDSSKDNTKDNALLRTERAIEALQAADRGLIGAAELVEVGAAEQVWFLWLAAWAGRGRLSNAASFKLLSKEGYGGRSGRDRIMKDK